MSSLFRTPKINPPPEPSEAEARKKAQEKLRRVRRSTLSELQRRQRTGASQLQVSGLGLNFFRRTP